MIDTKLRKNAQPAFDRVGKIAVRLKLSANKITLLAFLIGMVAGVMTGLNYMIAALILLWISGLLDVLDGTVARLSGKSSKLGAFMDLIFDRMVEAGIIMGFYFLNPEYALACLLFFVSVLFNFSTFMVAGALYANDGNKSMHYDVGIAERTETFLVFSAMMLVTDYAGVILMVFNGVIFLTGIIRFRRMVHYNLRDGSGNEK